MFANKAHEEAYNLLKEQKYTEALALLINARDLNPEHPDVHGDMGVIYIHLKEKEKALQAFNDAIALQPNYSYRYSSRAYAKDFFGDLDGGIDDYQRAVELDPEDAVAYNNLGLLLEKKGYTDKAKENFERADTLSKIENDFFKVMSDLEKDGQTAEKAENTVPESEKRLADPSEIRAKNVSRMEEFKRIFTSKKQFNEFISYIKNGFKL